MSGWVERRTFVASRRPAIKQHLIRLVQHQKLGIFQPNHRPRTIAPRGQVTDAAHGAHQDVGRGGLERFDEGDTFIPRLEEVGGWVRKIEENEAVVTSYCELG